MSVCFSTNCVNCEWIICKYNFQIQLLTVEQWQMVAMATLLTSVLTLGVYAWLIVVQPQSTHASRSSITIVVNANSYWFVGVNDWSYIRPIVCC